jgi:hypothetical protein
LSRRGWVFKMYNLQYIQLKYCTYNEMYSNIPRRQNSQNLPVVRKRNSISENNSPTCLSRGFEVSYTRDEDFPEPPASGNPNPECTIPRTRVTNINEYYFCNVKAVRHQFYLIYCLFISYVNVNNYVSLFLTVSVHCSLGCHTAEKH